MKAVMLMFDSLNRHMLPPYGGTFIHAPNFQRLAQRTVTFDRSYVCSMPCMPARRDLHTARPNFLHRSWGPLEPFDDSVPQMLREAGIYTHLATDHYHYFEDGGSTYHGRYNSWAFFRGQEGDAWQPSLRRPNIPPCIGRNAANNPWTIQDWANRAAMTQEHLQPQAQTMSAGIQFIRQHHQLDNWFLQIETFDPHEPFFTQRKYKDLYAKHYEAYRKMGGKHFDWPMYDRVKETPQEIEHLRCEYAALVSMCDVYLGDVLDAFDALDLWKDTMLIVCTDHGFLLGEHECWAKLWMPFYEEVARTPFFVWDPRCGQQDQRRKSLVQPAIDIGPTLLDYFGLTRTADMTGHNLKETIASDKPVRQAGIFGVHGGQVNVTDGRYVYMRAAARQDNQPLFEYTLMPTHMRTMFSVKELEGENTTLSQPLPFTKGCRTLKIQAGRYWGSHPDIRRTLLYDVQTDPQQRKPLQDPALEQRMIGLLVEEMKKAQAPAEQYQRLDLPG